MMCSVDDATMASPLAEVDAPALQHVVLDLRLNGGGMSLGLITGLNADEDITTRSPDLDSEPSYCVPPIPAPNFAAPPASLPATTRGTFALQPANEFLGAPDRIAP